MSNQCRQVKRAFCKWAPLNQNTEGQLLERGVLSSSNMKKKKTTTQIQKGNEIKGGIKEGKWGEGRDSCCWGGGGQSSVTKQARPRQTLQGPAFKPAWKGGDGGEMDGGRRGHWSERRERERERRRSENSSEVAVLGEEVLICVCGAPSLQKSNWFVLVFYRHRHFLFLKFLFKEKVTVAQHDHLMSNWTLNPFMFQYITTTTSHCTFFIISSGGINTQSDPVLLRSRTDITF